MFLLKKRAPRPKPFARVFPSRWIIEYSGTLPHCARQRTQITHQLFCSRLDPKRLLLEEGIEIIGAAGFTHCLWCICRLDKDRGDIRCLFRRYLALSEIKGNDWQDWVAFKVTQHLHIQLLELSDFHFILPCKSRHEYYWCAEEDDFNSYWQTEIETQLKALIKVRRKS